MMVSGLQPDWTRAREACQEDGRGVTPPNIGPMRLKVKICMLFSWLSVEVGGFSVVVGGFFSCGGWLFNCGGWRPR